METAFAELPLAVFTTLAPVAAGAFIAWAVALCTGAAAEGAGKNRLERMTLIPLLVAFAGFAASALHTANPAHGVDIVAGFGRSPLTNEIAAGALFMVIALVYVIAAYAGKNQGKHKTLALVAAAASVVFALFVGAAYLVPTIPSWNSALLPIEIVGFALVGGTALLSLMEVLGAKKAARSKALAWLAVASGVIAIIASIAHLGLVANMTNAVASGAGIVAVALPYAIIGLILIAVSTALCARGFLKGMSMGVSAAAVICSLAGIFLMRLSFYALYLSVGVTLL